ncbi:MAG TPA: hotdog domain-containing protein [Candidatus Acidoferrales bacterium]|nr:hotdog domain-containing protein [Candidatus Acidoferrales bacterium]
MKKKSRKPKAAPKPKIKPQYNIPGIAKGLHSKIECVVPFEWTIAAYDSTLPAVFSTPAMIGLMELAAAQAIRPHLPAGTISVGTRIEVDHLKAVGQGEKVEATARLTGMRGRFLVFETEARADETLIGSGRVFRAIVVTENFHKRSAE